jgi:hypothetical protein
VNNDAAFIVIICILGGAFITFCAWLVETVGPILNQYLGGM